MGSDAKDVQANKDKLEAALLRCLLRCRSRDLQDELAAKRHLKRWQRHRRHRHRRRCLRFAGALDKNSLG
jgi:hypothetical protein